MNQFEMEPERYELSEPARYQFELARRDFFRVLGGGLVVALAVRDAAALQEPGRGGRGERAPQQLAAWLHIAESGEVTVYTGKAELGQNARTSLTQMVAEELPVPLAAIRLVMADTDLTPYDAGTFGSRTSPTMAPQLRRVAAAAREALRELAAERWKADRNSLVIAESKVTNPAGGESLTFGQLTKGQKLLKTVGDDTPTAPAERWKIAGTPIRKVNGREMVTGAHRFTPDLKRSGMLRGKILRPPALNARLAALDTRAAEAIPGVAVVRDGEFAGVTAPDEQTALRALAAFKAEWSAPPAQPSEPELFEYFKKTMGGQTRGGAGSPYVRGSIEEGLAAAGKKLRQGYTVAYIAHAPLEPRAAVAEWNEGKLTVWTGTQRPFGVRSELMEAFRLPESQVRVIVPDMGSGYGGKHTGDAAVEAARLARAAGKPVKVVWTREEEFSWGYLRPAGLIEISSGVSDDGRITAWDFHNYNSGGAAIRTMYDIPNQRIEFHAVRSPLRQGSYRALAATANHFARETHMDELAQAAGMDPLEFRLKNLKDARFRAVLEVAAEKFGWGKTKPSEERGLGLAGGFEKGSYVATCAEVRIDRARKHVRIARVVEAFECGGILNPDHLKNQAEGAIVQAIGGALFEAIHFENGQILNGRFSAYRVPRFTDLPQIEVVLLDRKDLPSAGGGETPIVGLAPATGNAIFSATGRRLRSLPLSL